jgi:hypothetical protein
MIMRKIWMILMALFLVPVFSGAQESPLNYSLKYEGIMTVNDKRVVGGEEEYKTGRLRRNNISFDFFFWESYFQLGVSGSYSQENFLADHFQVRRLEKATFGPRLRLSSQYNFEVKTGVDYFFHWGEIRGERVDQDGYSLGEFERRLKSQGVEVPLEFIFSQLRFQLLPKMELSLSQRFVFGDGQGIDLQRRPIEFSGEVLLYRIDISPSLYISPLVGIESREIFLRGPVYKIGFSLDSNLARANVIRFGYFFDLYETGIEGFFISLDLLGVFAK